MEGAASHCAACRSGTFLRLLRRLLALIQILLRCRCACCLLIVTVVIILAVITAHQTLHILLDIVSSGQCLPLILRTIFQLLFLKLLHDLAVIAKGNLDRVDLRICFLIIVMRLVAHGFDIIIKRKIKLCADTSDQLEHLGKRCLKACCNADRRQFILEGHTYIHCRIYMVNLLAILLIRKDSLNGHLIAALDACL